MKYIKIKHMDQYNEYCEIHEKLTFENYDANLDEIELLEILIDEYEERTIEYPQEMNPVELVEYLLDENNMTKSQLAKEIKVSRQLITDILSYRRNISKSTVIKLADRFKMKHVAFNRHYKLKKLKLKSVKQTA